MKKPHLSVVDIKPPEYKDPVKMLRNLADELEAGEYPNVATLVIGLWCDTGMSYFGGGRDSGMEHCAFVFGAAQTALLRLPSNPCPCPWTE